MSKHKDFQYYYEETLEAALEIIYVQLGIVKTLQNIMSFSKICINTDYFGMHAMQGLDIIIKTTVCTF